MQLEKYTGDRWQVESDILHHSIMAAADSAVVLWELNVQWD